MSNVPSCYVGWRCKLVRNKSVRLAITDWLLAASRPNKRCGSLLSNALLFIFFAIVQFAKKRFSRIQVYNRHKHFRWFELPKSVGKKAIRLVVCEKFLATIPHTAQLWWDVGDHYTPWSMQVRMVWQKPGKQAWWKAKTPRSAGIVLVTMFFATPEIFLQSKLQRLEILTSSPIKRALKQKQ